MNKDRILDHLYHRMKQLRNLAYDPCILDVVNELDELYAKIEQGDFD